MHVKFSICYIISNKRKDLCQVSTFSITFTKIQIHVTLVTPQFQKKLNILVMNIRKLRNLIKIVINMRKLGNEVHVTSHDFELTVATFVARFNRGEKKGRV